MELTISGDPFSIRFFAFFGLFCYFMPDLYIKRKRTLACKYEQPLSSSWQTESEKRTHGSNPGNRKGFHHSLYAVISFQISLCHSDLCLAGIKADIILEGSRIFPDDNNLPGVKNKCKPDNWWSLLPLFLRPELPGRTSHTLHWFILKLTANKPLCPLKINRNKEWLKL